jgi:hypothetical protein
MITAIVFGVIAVALWGLTYVARAAFRSLHRNDHGFIVVPICAVVSSAVSIGSFIRAAELQSVVLPVLLVLMGLMTIGALVVWVMGYVGIERGPWASDTHGPGRDKIVEQYGEATVTQDIRKGLTPVEPGGKF